jgi:hypothetical protein
VNDPEFLERLPALLPYGAEPAGRTDVHAVYSLLASRNEPDARVKRFNIVYENGNSLIKTLDTEEAIEVLENRLRFYVASWSQRRIFVHAGAVAWRGKAVLILGRAGSGRTSLLSELVKSGARYYSDEYAVIDGGARLHPFPGPLSVRHEDGSGRSKVPVEDLGGRQGIRPIPIGLVLVASYKPGSRWRPRRLSPGKGMLELLSVTIPARSETANALGKFQRLVLQAPVLRGNRGDAHETARLILDRCNW